MPPVMLQVMLPVLVTAVIYAQRQRAAVFTPPGLSFSNNWYEMPNAFFVLKVTCVGAITQAGGLSTFPNKAVATF
jgi:hypothetical protein